MKLVCFILTMVAVFFLSYAHAEDLTKDIFISHAWVQAMPPSQISSAAYMVITNNSSKEAILVSASSDIAGAVEIHQMSEMNGMMNMAMVSNVHVPALGKVILQPGGYHIMLINLKKSVKKGDIIPMTLHFQDGSSIIVKAEARLQQEDDAASLPGMKM